MNNQMTIRQARTALFAINTPDADLLRREFFDLKEQDVPMDAEQERDFRLVVVTSKMSAQAR